jgi:cobalt/nickel transport system permease protein
MPRKSHNPLPVWLNSVPTPDSPTFLPTQPRGKRISPFAEKTIHSIFAIFQEFLYLGAAAQHRGFLEQLDPRAKLIVAMILLLTVSLLHSPGLLAFVIFGLGAAAVLSRVRFQFFLGRTWILVPLYTMVLAIPAAFNWITPGNPIWTLFRFEQELRFGPWSFPTILAVTDSGLRAASLLVLRVGASLFVAILLLATTSWQNLLRAMRCLAVPQFLVFALSMTVRYIYLLLGLALDWHLARKSRTLRTTRWRQDQVWMAAQVGYLFKRSQGLAGSIYLSMMSRGFRGEPKVTQVLKWRPNDLVVIAVVTCFCLVIYLVQVKTSW